MPGTAGWVTMITGATGGQASQSFGAGGNAGSGGSVGEEWNGFIFAAPDSTVTVATGAGGARGNVIAATDPASAGQDTTLTTSQITWTSKAALLPANFAVGQSGKASWKGGGPSGGLPAAGGGGVPGALGGVQSRYTTAGASGGAGGDTGAGGRGGHAPGYDGGAGGSPGVRGGGGGASTMFGRGAAGGGNSSDPGIDSAALSTGGGGATGNSSTSGRAGSNGLGYLFYISCTEVTS